MSDHRRDRPPQAERSAPTGICQQCREPFSGPTGQALLLRRPPDSLGPRAARASRPQGPRSPDRSKRAVRPTCAIAAADTEGRCAAPCTQFGLHSVIGKHRRRARERPSRTQSPFRAAPRTKNSRRWRMKRDAGTPVPGDNSRGSSSKARATEQVRNGGRPPLSVHGWRPSGRCRTRRGAWSTSPAGCRAGSGRTARGGDFRPFDEFARRRPRIGGVPNSFIFRPM
jgi:hypothetical protein